MQTRQLVILTVFLFTQELPLIEGRGRRCYTCRSRGELGDCKDPFSFNATTVDDTKGVEALPCASGWCAKIVEGGSEDFDTATERMCVQRPPIDGEERCSETIIERRPVYMCFCVGDLCNSGFGSKPLTTLQIGAFCAFLMTLWFLTWWISVAFCGHVPHTLSCKVPLQ